MSSDNLRQCPTCKCFFTPDHGPMKCNGEPGEGHDEADTVEVTDWNEVRYPIVMDLRAKETKGEITEAATKSAIQHLSDVSTEANVTVEATPEKGVKLLAPLSKDDKEFDKDGVEKEALVAVER